MHDSDNKVNFYERLEGFQTAMRLAGIKLTFASRAENARKVLLPGTPAMDLTSNQHLQMADYVDKEFHATVIIENSDNNWYGEMVNPLNNNFIQGTDCYPKTEADARRLHQLFQTTYVQQDTQCNRNDDINEQPPDQ